MRRICALLLTAAFGLGVVGCSEPAAPPKKPDTTTKPAPKPSGDEKKAGGGDEKKAGGADEKKP